MKNIVFGNTLGTGKAKEGFVDGDGHPDEKFHYMLANPPFGVEWKPEKAHVTEEYEDFGFKGRFGPGLPRINDGALLFLLDEQAQIVDYLDAKSKQFDAMEKKVAQVIDRLTEYRTALITAATTGKIDVRGVKIPQPVQS